MAHDYDNKPGCFGSPLCHGDLTLVCSKCPFQAECGVAAESCAERLRATYRIAEAFGRHRPKRGPVRASIGERSFTTTVDPSLGGPRLAPIALAPEQPEGMAMPKKGWELMQSLQKRGIDLPRALALRVNPFEVAPPRHMKVLFGLLLTGGFSRADARQSLMTDLGWSEASASSHVGSATAVLIAAGVAIEDAGKVVPL